jgi:hypothetical protein
LNAATYARKPLGDYLFLFSGGVWMRNPLVALNEHRGEIVMARIGHHLPAGGPLSNMRWGEIACVRREHLRDQ